jgi:hypothetical protein
VLVFGHTHKPWIHDYGGVRFVNCGSVGKPKDGDLRAAFAVLEARGDDVAPSIDRVAYDALAVAREMRTAGLPEELAERLVRCRLGRVAGCTQAAAPERRAQRFDLFVFVRPGHKRAAKAANLQAFFAKRLGHGIGP